MSLAIKLKLRSKYLKKFRINSVIILFFICFLGDRPSQTASVIGMPTNISCTAGDVLANCVPIDKSPRNSKNLSIDGSSDTSKRDSIASNVTITSRESLLDEIIQNAQGLGIDTLGLTQNEVDAGVKRRQYSSASSVRDSMRSTDSSSSRRSRPSIAPPPPPPTFIRNSALRASRSEGDLLQATNKELSLVSGGAAVVGSMEAMLEVEYTTVDEQADNQTSGGVGTSSRPHSQILEEKSPCGSNNSPSSTLKRYDLVLKLSPHYLGFIMKGFLHILFKKYN